MRPQHSDSFIHSSQGLLGPHSECHTHFQVLADFTNSDIVREAVIDKYSMIHPETSDNIVTLTIVLTFGIVSIVYSAKYQYTGAGRSWISFSAGEFLCKKHFWQSQWPKGGFILTEGWFADLGPDSFHRHSGISDIRHRTKGLQKHIRDVETDSRCVESRAPDHILDDIWSYTKVGKNNVTRRQSTSLLTPVTAKHEPGARSTWTHNATTKALQSREGKSNFSMI